MTKEPTRRASAGKVMLWIDTECNLKIGDLTVVACDTYAEAEKRKYLLEVMSCVWENVYEDLESHTFLIGEEGRRRLINHISDRIYHTRGDG